MQRLLNGCQSILNVPPNFNSVATPAIHFLLIDSVLPRQSTAKRPASKHDQVEECNRARPLTAHRSNHNLFRIQEGNRINRGNDLMNCAAERRSCMVFIPEAFLFPVIGRLPFVPFTKLIRFGLLRLRCKEESTVRKCDERVNRCFASRQANSTQRSQIRFQIGHTKVAGQGSDLVRSRPFIPSVA